MVMVVAAVVGGGGGVSLSIPCCSILVSMLAYNINCCHLFKTF